MDETLPTPATPVKDRILSIYFTLCETSSTLMSQMKGARSGNKQLTYITFEVSLLELYTMCSVFKLHSDTKNIMNQWVSAKRGIPVSDTTIMKSIHLFEAFSRELVEMQVIKV